VGAAEVVVVGVGAAEVAGAAEDPGAVAFGSRGFRRAGAMNRGAAAGFTAGNPKSSEQVFQPAAQAAGFLLGRALCETSLLPGGTAASAADKARTSDRTPIHQRGHGSRMTCRPTASASRVEPFGAGTCTRKPAAANA